MEISEGLDSGLLPDSYSSENSGNTIGRSSAVHSYQQRQQSSSRKRKLEAEAAIDPFQSALKVLRVEEQPGGDQSNDPQSFFFVSPLEVNSAGIEIELRSFGSPDQPPLGPLPELEYRAGNDVKESLTALDSDVEENNPGDGNSDLLSPLRASNVQHNPAGDEYRIRCRDPDEPALPGLRSFKVPAVDVDNALSFSRPYQPVLEGLRSEEGLSEGVNNSLSFSHSQEGVLEGLQNQEGLAGDVDYALCSSRTHEPVLERLQSVEGLFGNVDNALSISHPHEPVLEGLQRGKSPSRDVDNGFSISHPHEQILEGLQNEESSSGTVDNVLSISQTPPGLDTRHGTENMEAETAPKIHIIDLETEFEALDVVKNGGEGETRVYVSYGQSEVDAPLDLVANVGENETKVCVSDHRLELEAPRDIVEYAVGADDAKVLISASLSEVAALHVLQNYGEDDIRVGDPHSKLEAQQVVEDEATAPISNSESGVKAQPVHDLPVPYAYHESEVENAEVNEALVPIVDSLSEMETQRVRDLPVSFSHPEPEGGSLQAVRNAGIDEVMVPVSHLVSEAEAQPVHDLPVTNTRHESEVEGQHVVANAELDEAMVPSSNSFCAPEAQDVHDLPVTHPHQEAEVEGQQIAKLLPEFRVPISDSLSEVEAMHVVENLEEDEPMICVSYPPQSELEAKPFMENNAAEDGANLLASAPHSDVETLHMAENCGEDKTVMDTIDPRSELDAQNVLESAGEGEAKTLTSDPQLLLEAQHFPEIGGQEEAKDTVIKPQAELDALRHKVEDPLSTDPERRKKLLLLSAVSGFFSTLAGALGCIGELVGQIENTTAMSGELYRTDIAGTSLADTTTLRLHSAMTRSSNSLRNNIVVLMFLIMQQYRKRSQKRPRELTGPWYIKPRSAQAFESFLDFSPQGDPDKFRELFRISPRLFFHICELVSDEMLSDTPRSLRVLPNRVLTVERQVAIAIRRLATGNQFLGIADSFGVSKSTAVKVTWKFIVAFIKKAGQHLQWPTGEDMRQNKDGFKMKWGFPNCCGVVDGTHFTVEFPKGEDVTAYYDHQNHVSISMQALVGHDLRFLDVVVGWPGSVQDYQLLQNTNFFRSVVNAKDRLNGDPFITQDGSPLREYVLGDAGYPLYDWLMVPYPGGLSAAKDEWNSRHAAARQCVEDALVRLKGTWKILSRILWKPRKERIGKMVFACCLLHNMIIERQDGLSPEVYAGVNPHPGGYTGVSEPTLDVYGGLQAREILFREVMGGGII